MRFDAQGIDLAEAVRITLQNSPDIRLAQTEASQRLGAAQQQTGAFDTSLLANTNYNYQRQELTPTTKLSEDLKRQDLRDARDSQLATKNNLEALLAQLRSIQGTPPGSTQLTQIRALDPSTASDLQVIDALYSSQIATADPTLQRDLITLRNQLISDTIVRSQSGVTQALGAFNQLNTLVTNLGVTPEQEYFGNGGLNVSLARLFRNGISFSPFLSGTGNTTNFIDKPFDTEFGGKGIFPLYNFQGGVHVTVPLARGLGATAVAAPERSSLIFEEAARLDVQHQAASSALGTISAYWGLRAAQENVAIAQASVAQQGRIVQLTRATIAAGDLPQVELARVQASEARSQATLRDAESALHQARVALATAMGVAVTDDDATLPRAREDFPAAPDAAAVNEQRMAALAASGVKQRRDVAAAQRRQAASDVLVRGAQSNLKARVDLLGGTWFTGVDEAVVTNALNRWVGPSYNVTLDIEKPFGNNLLRGLLVEAQAGSASSQILTNDLQRQVRLGVVRTVRSLNEAIERVRQAQAAVNFYQQTIESEIARFQIGEVRLIDTITTEAQQADALRTLVAARRDLAELIAELRFQTGTLVQDVNAPVAPQALTTVPQN
jgi:outer membrane protein TolC